MARSRRPSGSCDVGLRSTCSASCDAEHVLGQAVPRRGSSSSEAGLCRMIVLPRHPAEPHAHGHQARVLAAEAQRLAVLLPVVEQIPLIAFEHRPRDLGRLGRARARRTRPGRSRDARGGSAPCLRSSCCTRQRFEMLLHQGVRAASSARPRSGLTRHSSPRGPYGYDRSVAATTTTDFLPLPGISDVFARKAQKPFREAPPLLAPAHPRTPPHIRPDLGPHLRPRPSSSDPAFFPS